MSTVEIALPKVVLLNISKDYARNVPNSGVEVLDRRFVPGLQVGWNAEALWFVAAEGGVSYRRDATFGFHYGRRRIMRWIQCELRIGVGEEGQLPVLYTDSVADEPHLQQVIRQMLDAGVPLAPIIQDEMMG